MGGRMQRITGMQFAVEILEVQPFSVRRWGRKIYFLVFAMQSRPIIWKALAQMVRVQRGLAIGAMVL